MTNGELAIVRRLQRELAAAEAEIRRLRDEFITVVHICQHQPAAAEMLCRLIAENAIKSSRLVYPLDDE